MPVTEPLSTAALVKEARKRLGLTQLQFAKTLGVSFQSVNRWERGRTKPLLIALKHIEVMVKEMGDITWEEEHHSQENAPVRQQAVTALPQMADLEALRERILLDLKLGKQVPGYKAAQKALNRFIAELTNLA